MISGFRTATYHVAKYVWDNVKRRTGATNDVFAAYITALELSFANADIGESSLHDGIVK